MKKNTILSFFRGKANCLLKNNLKMKLSVLLMVFSILQVFPNKGYSQKKVSFNLKDVTIKEVFNEIQNQTDFKFLYRNTVVNVNSRVSLKAKNKTTLKVLDRLFRNTQIEYQIIEKQIVLTKKELPLINSVFKDQTKEIKGRVTDSDGQPLPGASIVEKGTANGIQSDFDGKFSLGVEGNSAVLIVSYIGYLTKEITLDTVTDYTIILNTDAQSLDEVTLLGSRNPNRTSTETPVPVDVVNMVELAIHSPQVSVNQILNYVVPSFSSNTQTIADGTDHIDPASLRGLGPDQVLVLVNGKRRHTSSLINVNGSFGRGSVGTDLNAIPAFAIERIEILRDGAAAQYGSDAIAGVINVVLKKNTNELNVNMTSGANMSKNSNGQTGGIDGENFNLAVNYGLGLGKNGGFVNFTGEVGVRDYYNRMKEFEGNIFSAYNAVEYVAQQDGYDIAVLPKNLNDIKRYGKNVSFFSTQLKDKINNATSISELQGILKVDATVGELKVRNQRRSSYNMRVGQSAFNEGKFFANMELPLDSDKATKLYTFFGMGYRMGNSAANYRLPNRGDQVYTPVFVNGFLPELNTRISDRSLGIGIKGSIDLWNVDFSNTFGINSFNFIVDNTSNASLQNETPITFDAGGFQFFQNTTNLDISRFYKTVLNGLNVAFGSEYRVENYEILSGDQESWGQYTDDGDIIADISQIPAEDFFGKPRGGGSQSYSGFRPVNELFRSRSSLAGYLDLELDVTKRFLLNGATRFEYYSDFGSTINFKLASRIKLLDKFNFRLAVNTGFRAPSLHQLHYNSTSIFFKDGIAVSTAVFANDSKAAKLFGIPQLKQEISRSISTGITLKIPDANIDITADAYFVAIGDRVVLTEQFKAPGKGSELDNIFKRANASAAIFFSNAIDTESRGFDVVITHKMGFNNKLKLKTDLSGTFSQTRRVGKIKSSVVLKKAGLEASYFSERNRIYLEEAIPRTKANLSMTLSGKKLSVFLRNVYFGKVTEAEYVPLRQQVFNPKVITDLSTTYNITNNLGVTIGANNIFDIYPDKANLTLSDGTENLNRSKGKYNWSRASQQFGFGGRFAFARLSLTIK